MKKKKVSSKWFMTLLTALLGSSRTLKEMLLDLLNFIARSQKFGDVCKEAARLNGYPVAKLNAAATKAVQFTAGINNQQLRQLRSCFLAELACLVFPVI